MLGGGADGDSLGGRTALLGGAPHKLKPAAAGMIGTSSGCGGGEEALPRKQRGKEERVSKWSQQETGDLIAIRAEADRNLMAAPQNYTLWEVVAAGMKERGYIRTAEQCKCKWKNLVSYYKGKEIAGPQNGWQCPSDDDLNAGIEERGMSMDWLLHESTSGIPKSNKKLKRLVGDTDSVEFINEEEDENYRADGAKRQAKSRLKKAENRASQMQRTKAAGSTEELLLELLHQHRRMEAQWAEMVERRERERRAMEQEWRRAMEEMERERRELERAWREREEERRKKEESRAEKREALLTTLLNKLINDAGDV